MSTHMPLRPVAPMDRDALTVVTSDRWDDVKHALAVVHDGFVEAGYMEPQPSGRRLIGPYLNDGVTFCIAYVGSEIAGVLALIPDGPFGLPSDAAFRGEMDALREAGRPMFESGSLVVVPRWRRHLRKVLPSLVAGSMRVFRETPGATVVISTEPCQKDFYRSLLGAEPISKIRDLYGAPAILLASEYVAMVEVLGLPRTNGQRLMKDLVLNDDAPWLAEGRSGERWPEHEVAVLMAEQVSLDQLLAPVTDAGGIS